MPEMKAVMPEMKAVMPEMKPTGGSVMPEMKAHICHFSKAHILQGAHLSRQKQIGMLGRV
jgi:hypothetical protein